MRCWTCGGLPSTARRLGELPVRSRALRRLDHWLTQAGAHLQRLEASPKALQELERLGERLRAEIYER